MVGHRILIVCTSHARLGALAKPTGLWLEELAAPYWAFHDAGCEVEIVSMTGGEVPLDPRSLAAASVTPATRRFLDDARCMDAVKSTRALRDRGDALRDAPPEALFLPGGHGAMWDFPADESLASLVARVYDDGRVVAAVCHGPAGLVGALRADGKALVGARRVTGFTNTEEAEVGLTDAVPFLLETRLRELGAIFEAGRAFESHVVRDGNLVTGQNPQSSAATAEAVLAVLREPRIDPAVAARHSGLSVQPEPPR